MALLAITPMLKLADQDVKILHIEPTDACNAACPQCSRETDSTFDKNNLHHLTVEQIQSIISDDSIKQLDKMFMCGDYGDPAAGKHTLEIYRYFRKLNPSITLGMNTNGGLRNISWWTELGQLLNTQKDYAVFSIDGLVDTNHIYRIGVNWEKLLENAKAFINAGGQAHWDMLVFEHNKHQVNEAKEFAQQLGFKWFRTKVSRRPLIDNLQYPVIWTEKNAVNKNISCSALKEQSVYIDAQGRIYPCCWLADTELDITKFNFVKESWTSNRPVKICNDICGHNNLFTNQWQTEIEFNA